jgi:hypothetical protein
VPLDGSQDLGCLGHAAGSVLAAGHVAVIGPDHHDAVLSERCQVALGGRVLPHAHVHRRGDEDRLVGGKQRRGGEVGRQA